MLSLKKFLWLKDSSTIFCDKGFQVNFVKEKYLISHTKDDRLALCGVRKANLYVADLNSGTNDEDNCFYSKASPEDSWLWHKKLSHLNFKIVNSLVKRDLVRGLPPLEFTQQGLCEACRKGKAKIASYKGTDTSNITEPLQLLHMDLFGPVNVMSLSRKRYALVIADDFSKFTWVLFLHSKDETPQLVIDLIKEIELDSNDKLCVREISSNNGTEFKNETLNRFCSDNGITRQYSAPSIHNRME